MIENDEPTVRTRMGPHEVLVAAGCLLLLGTVAVANLQEASVANNETAAIATLRNLASCQAQIQTSGKIDVDQDGIGEYGTFLELTGSVGVRRGLNIGEGSGPAGATFKAKGKVVMPPILSPAMANLDKTGFVAKSGYAFMIFLPDTSRPFSLFVHETGPAASVGLAGGTGKIGIDLSETTWCAYAQPVVRGTSGNRRFFVNQSGDVMQSANDVGKRQGVATAIEGNSAFRVNGITGTIAVGTRGMDGDVWKVTD